MVQNFVEQILHYLDDEKALNIHNDINEDMGIRYEKCNSRNSVSVNIKFKC